ncbi:MAG TPA: hypothetical protein VFW40_08030 [Capsulimonadaceae bacterium]|nr:hypothetical protein [Capsulimonadaceae bacterium]
MTNRSLSTKSRVFAAVCLCMTGAMLLSARPAPAQNATVQPAASYKPLAGQQGQSAWSPVTNTWNLAFVGGTPILRVRSAWAGFDPHVRAMMVQQRVNNALSVGPVHPGEITVGQLQGDWCVLFRGRRFLTADLTTARQEHSNPKALAMRWAHRMRQVIPNLTRPTG